MCTASGNLELRQISPHMIYTKRMSNHPNTHHQPRQKDTTQAKEIIAELDALYPTVHTFLDHTNAFELLIATVLSAQTTDLRVNSITPTLFSQWPTPKDLAHADTTHVENIVRPLGFGARRAQQITTLAKQLLTRHNGEVPVESADLEALAGVGRKTANVIRGNWFGIPALTVDTHVGRLSQRFGWTDSTQPIQIEKDVTEMTPGVNWTDLSHRIILHGRQVCTARKPRCGSCTLAQLCPSAGAF